MKQFKWSDGHRFFLELSWLVLLLILAYWFYKYFPVGDDLLSKSTLIYISIYASTILALLVYAFFTYKKIHSHDVCIDDDGIWYLDVGKKYGLVRWRDVTHIIHNARKKRLDLTVREKEDIFKVYYGLDGFEGLKKIIKKATKNALITQEKTNKIEKIIRNSWIFVGIKIITYYFYTYPRTAFFILFGVSIFCFSEATDPKAEVEYYKHLIAESIEYKAKVTELRYKKKFRKRDSYYYYAHYEFIGIDGKILAGKTAINEDLYYELWAIAPELKKVPVLQFRLDPSLYAYKNYWYERANRTFVDYWIRYVLGGFLFSLLVTALLSLLYSIFNDKKFESE